MDKVDTVLIKLSHELVHSPTFLEKPNNTLIVALEAYLSTCKNQVDSHDQCGHKVSFTLHLNLSPVSY